MEQVPPTLEDIAYCFTLILKTVSPKIQESKTFELVAEFLEGDLADDERTRKFGKLIRATVGYKGRMH